MKKFIDEIRQFLFCKSYIERVKFHHCSFFSFVWTFWCEVVNCLNLRAFILYNFLLAALFMINFSVASVKNMGSVHRPK